MGETQSLFQCELVKFLLTQLSEVFCALPEVQKLITEGNGDSDEHGVNRAFNTFMPIIFESINKNYENDNLSELEKQALFEMIEKEITQQLYWKLFPDHPTKLDTEFDKRCKILNFLNYQNLEIPQKYRIDAMWGLTGEYLQKMDQQSSCFQKQKCIWEMFKTIANILDLTVTSIGQGYGADDSLPCLIYVVLKASPPRVYSTLKQALFVLIILSFINAFQYTFIQMEQSQAMKYSFLNLYSAVFFIKNLSFKQVKEIDELIFERTIIDNEIEYGVVFTRRRERSERTDILITYPQQQIEMYDEEHLN